MDRDKGEKVMVLFVSRLRTKVMFNVGKRYTRQCSSLLLKTEVQLKEFEMLLGCPGRRTNTVVCVVSITVFCEFCLLGTTWILRSWFGLFATGV